MIDRVGRFFSSMNLTIFLLLALAGILAMATVHEAENGTPAAKVSYYRAAWFDGFLLILAANIVGCTYYRLPRRSARWAYLLLHQSILVIFAGGLIGRWYGQEGQMAIREGETSAQLVAESSTLKVDWSTGERYEFPTATIDAFPRRLAPESSWRTSAIGKLRVLWMKVVENTRPVGFVHQWLHTVWPDAAAGERPSLQTFSLPRHGVRVRVDGFYPDYHEDDSAVDGKDSDGPAAQLTFSAEGNNITEWLYAKDHDHSHSVAGIRLKMSDGPVPPIPDEDRRVGVGGWIELLGADGKTLGRVLATGAEGQSLVVPGTKYHVRVTKLYSNFSMKGNEPADDPSAADNPAVLFYLDAPGLSEPRVAFAKFPEFDGQRPHKSGVQVRYTYRPRQLSIYRSADGALTARYSGTKDIITGPVKVGGSYPIADMDGLKVKIEAVKAHARPGKVAVNKSFEIKRPAIHAVIENDGGQQELWLPFFEPRTVAFGKRTMTLEYTKLQIPLTFELKLDKFVVGRYPGTMNPASFASTVKVVDKPAKRDFGVEISMNEPLVHNGYTFYQSSYVEGKPMTSILQVGRDPGGPIAYVGFFGFMAGLFCIIWARPTRIKPTAPSRGATAPTA